MKEVTLNIWWPLRLLPDEIEEMLQAEHIKELMQRHTLRCNMCSDTYDTSNRLLDRTIIAPATPHLIITDIKKDDIVGCGYEATCRIPEVKDWDEIFDMFNMPVVYPVIIRDIHNRPNYKICHFRILEYKKINDMGSSYGGVYYPYPARWVYPEDNVFFLPGPEKSLETRLLEEQKKRRKIAADKIKRGIPTIIDRFDDDGPSMDYRIKTYEDYGASGPKEPVLKVVEGESKPNTDRYKRPDFTIKVRKCLVEFDEEGNVTWKDIERKDEPKKDLFKLISDDCFEMNFIVIEAIDENEVWDIFWNRIIKNNPDINPNNFFGNRDQYQYINNHWTNGVIGIRIEKIDMTNGYNHIGKCELH